MIFFLNSPAQANIRSHFCLLSYISSITYQDSASSEFRFARGKGIMVGSGIIDKMACSSSLNDFSLNPSKLQKQHKQSQHISKRSDYTFRKSQNFHQLINPERLPSKQIAANTISCPGYVPQKSLTRIVGASRTNSHSQKLYFRGSKRTRPQ